MKQNPKNKLEKVSKIISESLDVDKILKIIKNPVPIPKNKIKVNKKSKVKIAVALDNSFNFYYDDNLNALRRNGASLTFFSPIKNKQIPNCDGLYIGGGFPEILGNNLSRMCC